ncbi:MAG: hypothetical protein M3R52_10970 [Acidobacteriota bacterium]|nr:hypothetical protein [Acidobacteriota bacterium]
MYKVQDAERNAAGVKATETHPLPRGGTDFMEPHILSMRLVQTAPVPLPESKPAKR